MAKRLTELVDKTIETIDKRLDALEDEKVRLIIARESLSYFKG
jgi:hypothetical protein